MGCTCQQGLMGQLQALMGGKGGRPKDNT